MRKVFLMAIGLLVISATLVSCDVLNSIPTNTTGGVFSLNGNWKLNSSTDNNAMVGSIVNVLPVTGNASIKTITNNTYCATENDSYWRSIKGNGSGGFSLSTLVSACNGSTVFNAGTINVINTDQITLTTRTAGGAELIQDWRRVK
jgi:hypothetical protein